MASSLVRVRPYASKLLPILAVGAVLALSWFAGNRVAINPRLVACAGYGYIYGYAGGPPSVAGVSPTSGSTAGGTTVAVTGTGFCGGGPVSAVDFGGVAATSFTVNSDTSLTAVSPAHALGTVDITVTNTMGTSATSSADQFTYGLALYYTWYDHASTGVNADTIHITNPSASTATVIMEIPGFPSMTVHVNAGYDGYFQFPQGTIGGPLSLVSNVRIISTLRAWYYQSFNETPARSYSAAATTQYYPWYDLASAGTRADTIHITNESGSTATGSITMASEFGGGAAPPSIPISVANGADAYFTFGAGVIGGPVTVTTDVPVLSSLRAWFNQSFNETLGYVGSSASTTQYFAWYDNASTGVRADTIHVTNESGTTATFTATVAQLGGGTATFTHAVASGADEFFEFPSGTIGGPLTITADQPVITSLRAWYYLSFNEVHGRAGSAAQMVQYFPWYDLASAGTNADTIHITNVSGTTANITITLSATGFIQASIPTGTDQFFTFGAGAIGGPVTIQSDQPVLASLRAWYYQSFNEVPGYS